MATNQDNIFKILEDIQYRAVGVDPDTKQMQEGYFVSFRNLGLPIYKQDFQNPYSPVGSNRVAIAKPDTFTTGSADLTAENIASADDISDAYKNFLNTFMLVDSKLQLNNEYNVMPGATKVSDSWYAIINGAQAIKSKADLSEAIKKDIADAQAVLYTPEGEETQKYKKYLEFEEKYEAANDALINAYTEANSDPVKARSWGARGVSFIRKKTQAFSDWGAFGFKTEVDTARDFLSAQGEDPATLLISKAKTDFNNSLVAVGGLGTYPYTFILPSNWHDPASNNWTSYSESEFKNHSTYKKSSMSIRGGGGWLGMFAAKGGTSSQSTQYENISSNLSISMEICVADVYRTGINTALLGLNNWFLSGDKYPKNCISDGTFTQMRPENHEGTFLPSIVTSIILIKNLKIRMEDASSSFKELINAKSAGLGIHFGALNLGGTGSTSSTERTFDSTITEKEILVPGVQLLGYVSTIMQASPKVGSEQFTAVPA